MKVKETCTCGHTHTNIVGERHSEKPTQLSKQWFTCWSSKVSPHFNTSLISLTLAVSAPPFVCHFWCLTIGPIFFRLLCLSLATLIVIAFCTSPGFDKQRSDNINKAASDCFFRKEVGQKNRVSRFSSLVFIVTPTKVHLQEPFTCFCSSPHFKW